MSSFSHSTRPSQPWGVSDRQLGDHEQRQLTPDQQVTNIRNSLRHNPHGSLSMGLALERIVAESHYERSELGISRSNIEWMAIVGYQLWEPRANIPLASSVSTHEMAGRLQSQFGFMADARDRPHANAPLVISSNYAVPGVAITAVHGQTAPAFQVVNADGTILFAVYADGTFQIGDNRRVTPEEFGRVMTILGFPPDTPQIPPQGIVPRPEPAPEPTPPEPPNEPRTRLIEI